MLIKVFINFHYINLILSSILSDYFPHEIQKSLTSTNQRAGKYVDPYVTLEIILHLSSQRHLVSQACDKHRWLMLGESAVSKCAIRTGYKF